MKSSAATAEVAQPYAQALLSVAKANNLTEEFGADARALISSISGSGEVQKFLDNPFIQPKKKKNLLRQLLGENANPCLKNFILLLVDKKRISFLEPILRQYVSLLRELNQTVLAEVTSAVPLTDEQLQTVREKVISITKAREVEIETKVDADLIGGVVIKVGSQVIDASLRGQLRRLSLRLTSG